MSENNWGAKINENFFLFPLKSWSNERHWTDVNEIAFVLSFNFVHNSYSSV